jgi:transcriptional regulator with XRE-family HTH domain
MRCDGTIAARLRKNLGYSQQDVADKAKCSKTTIERLERGIAVDYQTIHQVVAVLGVRFDDILRSDERGEAGADAHFITLIPLASIRELMDFAIRCDTVILDIVDTPEKDNVGLVVAILRELERCLPGTARSSWELLSKWRSSAVDRLEGILELEAIIGSLANTGMHVLVAEYIAFMSPEEAHSAAQNFVDSMEFTGLQGSDFDPRKRVGLLRVANLARGQLKIKVDDLATENPNASSAKETSTVDDLPF